MANTMDNLKGAFAGESQANRRYLAFAEKAQADGFPEIAALFRAVAAAETVHAHSHLRALGEIRSTAENLQAAQSGEHYEFTQMYPGFIETAKNEGNRRATTSFDYANQVEQVHHKLFTEAAEALAKGQEPPSGPWHVCSVCGHTVSGEPPEVCPICQSPKRVFQLVE
ncbi:MAG: rubrerythrin family protein [Bacteroidetes bacterium]|nr:rubrerythrin family protein [Bacteroidota bacterium]